MKIAIVTDAWYPQVNGVVRTLNSVGKHLTEDLNIDVCYITPQKFKTLPCPTYPEIRLSLCSFNAVRDIIRVEKPNAIHIATEGPLGFSARHYCIRKQIPFTTSYHTKFPEYIRERFPIPLSASYAFMRWFHTPARATLVTTETMKKELEARRFKKLVVWGRGVDTDLFNGKSRTDYQWTGRPSITYLYVGRVSVEKNIEAFLSLDLPAAKRVVGDGPDLTRLKKIYPDVEFVGKKSGADLAQEYANGDVFVFPSKTDTFGLVMLEANACGTPIAAYPVTGPVDVVKEGVNGSLDNDLKKAIEKALLVDRKSCREYAEQNSWKSCAQKFLDVSVKFKACKWL